MFLDGTNKLVYKIKQMKYCRILSKNKQKLCTKYPGINPFFFFLNYMCGYANVNRIQIWEEI